MNVTVTNVDIERKAAEPSITRASTAMFGRSPE
jgi:hypothetical protein